MGWRNPPPTWPRMQAKADEPDDVAVPSALDPLPGWRSAHGSRNAAGVGGTQAGRDAAERQRPQALQSRATAKHVSRRAEGRGSLLGSEPRWSACRASTNN